MPKHPTDRQIWIEFSFQFSAHTCTMFVPKPRPQARLRPEFLTKTKLIRLNHISHFLVTIKNCSIKFLWDFYNILLHAVAWWWSHYMISTKCTFHIIPCALWSCIFAYIYLYHSYEYFLVGFFVFLNSGIKD